MTNRHRFLIAAAIAFGIMTTVATARAQTAPEVVLTNVSYDPTRELYRVLNDAFSKQWQASAGQKVTIRTSHGGSGKQARSVIDGLEADVVTLALAGDIDAIARESKRLPANWQARLPNNASPYASTIVFVVRKGNPKGIRDWPDLVKPGVEVITPNPKTSGNGYLSFFSAWGSVVLRGGSRQAAIDYVTKLYRQVPVLDSGARGATVTFVQREIGDVHLAWENEARLEVQEARGELDVVYPPISIRAEPHVALVDANVDRKKTRAVAEAYLKYLYTDAAQAIIARHFYRPASEAALKAHAASFPALRMFSIKEIAADFPDAHKRFIAEGGVFDRIYKPR
jgi:sulfate/thiosulfate-binding protein